MAELPRDIKRRIRSVINTQQITRAMKMVAASKLRKVQDRTITLRPYTFAVTRLKDHLLESVGDLANAFVEERPEKTVGVVFFSGDRGLCGAYNSNLIREFEKFRAANPDRNLRVFVFGKKGIAHIKKVCRQKNSRVEMCFSRFDLIKSLSFQVSLEVTKKLNADYAAGTLDSMYVIYSQFVNMASQSAGTRKLWPPSVEQSNQEPGRYAHDYLYEPPAVELVRPILDRYISVSLYAAMMESVSSEYAARMTAMENATKNADDMIDSLTLEYNKARQAFITKELLDIVGGTEAMKAAK
ncbi:MAG: ATP synthase F1 subunit gamma [Candidatus Brocadiia bacterium]